MLDNVQVRTLCVLYPVKKILDVYQIPITWATTSNGLSISNFQEVLMVSNFSFIIY